MTFEERAKIAKEALKKQKGFTYEEMLAIQKKAESQSKIKERKKPFEFTYEEIQKKNKRTPDSK